MIIALKKENLNKTIKYKKLPKLFKVIILILSVYLQQNFCSYLLLRLNPALSGYVLYDFLQKPFLTLGMRHH